MMNFSFFHHPMLGRMDMVFIPGPVSLASSRRAVPQPIPAPALAIGLIQWSSPFNTASKVEQSQQGSRRTLIGVGEIFCYYCTRMETS
jgi:hypothetical protein